MQSNSGAIHRIVPPIFAVCAPTLALNGTNHNVQTFVWPSNFASPKSANLQWLLASRRTFAGLRSRCRIYHSFVRESKRRSSDNPTCGLWVCRSMIPKVISPAICNRSCHDRGLSERSKDLSVPPPIYCMTITGAPVSGFAQAPNNFTIYLENNVRKHGLNMRAYWEVMWVRARTSWITCWTIISESAWSILTATIWSSNIAE